MSLIGTVARSVRNAAPVPYVGRGEAGGLFGGMLSRGSRRAQMAAMGGVSTLFAVVSAISEACAAMDWYLERVVTDARRTYGPAEPSRTQIVRHPALDLWNTPNPWMSRHELVEASTQHLKLTGECWWVLVADPRAPRLPTEMWLVRPDRMAPVPDPTDFISGYVYTAPDGEKVPLETDKVIQVRLPNPLDPYRGMGPVQALLADLDSTTYSAEWNRRFFLNGAAPGGIVELDDTLPDTEFSRMRDRWYEQHRGVVNSNRVAFLERAHWKDRQFTMRDMQFVELRTVSREIIMEAFRIHKAILGQSTDVNRANADAADYQLARWNVDPTLSRYAGALNSRLLPRYATGAQTAFAYENPIPEDEQNEAAELTAKTNAYKTLIDAGVHPEDAAMVADLPPMRQASVAPAPTPAEQAPPDLAMPDARAKQNGHREKVGSWS